VDEFDPVQRPAHYMGTFKGQEIQVIDVIESFGLAEDYYLGNAVKYILRAKKKGNLTQDLRKAVWYLLRKANELEAERGV